MWDTVDVLIYSHSYSHQPKGDFLCDKEHEEEVIPMLSPCSCVTMSLSVLPQLEGKHLEGLDRAALILEHSVQQQSSFKYIDLIFEWEA